jgi:inorganic pyrophosphatase
MDKKAVPYVAHPWHGIHPGNKAPEELDVFIEITPQDTVKYEIDKSSGFIRLDRPQKFSNHVPTLYGFIPRTYCGELSGEHCSQKLNRKGIMGDGDPLDICVLSSSPITHGNIIITIIPIGGLRMIDKDEADDKIIGVLKGDDIYGGYKDIKDVPEALINKLKHYFLTYKGIPDEKIEKPKVEIAEVYGREEALTVVSVSMDDYKKTFI